MSTNRRIAHLPALALLSFVMLSGCMVGVHHWDDEGTGPSRDPLSRWGESCRHDSQCGGGLSCIDATCEPTRVGIYPVNALVAPGRTDGLEWDSDRYLPGWVWDDLDRARSRGDVSSLYSFMDAQRRAGWSRPDPYGYGFLSTDGWRYDDRLTISLADRGRQALDVFDPTWKSSAGWSGVRFDTRLMVAFDLWDEDARNDEPIGFAELDFQALREALHRGGTVYFDVYDQTAGQVLLVGVEVVPES